MADFPRQSSASGNLQFDTVEPTDNAAETAATGPVCAACKTPITSTYYGINDKLICPRCCDMINSPPPGNPVSRVVMAAIIGIAGGVLGSAVWYFVRHFLHFELGLVAILVGYLVGKGVRKGSASRGGLGYQIMAVIITYCCITANYLPDVVAARQRHAAAQANANVNHKPDGFIGFVNSLPEPLDSIVLAFALPFLMGIENIIGLLIIGIALWEAWKFNAPVKLAITGPYELKPAPAS